MTTRALPSPWLEAPTLSGAPALLGAIAAVLVPTLIRASVSGAVSGCEVTIYIPFVLLAAIFLDWRLAAGVALASSMVADLLFIGPPDELLEGACDYFGVSVFLTASAMVIGCVAAMRTVIAERATAAPRDDHGGGIVFSLENGEAWASWYGQGAPVRLGPKGEVAEMMQDFLAQIELSKRLAGETE